MATKRNKPKGERIEVYAGWKSVLVAAPANTAWYVRRVARNGRKVQMSCQPQTRSDARRTARRWNRDYKRPLPVFVIEQ